MSLGNMTAVYMHIIYKYRYAHSKRIVIFLRGRLIPIISCIFKFTTGKAWKSLRLSLYMYICTYTFIFGKYPSVSKCPKWFVKPAWSFDR